MVEIWRWENLAGGCVATLFFFFFLKKLWELEFGCLDLRDTYI